MDSRATEILTRYQSLKGQRSTWDSLWQECADICHPRRALITTAQPGGTAPSRTQLASNFDSTAQHSAMMLAQGQAARITPMGSRWFAFRPPADLASVPAAEAWYARAGEIVAQKLQASNFYSVQFETYLDRGVFGTAAKQVMPGKGGRGLHFRALTCGSYCIAENEFGEIDTLYYAYKWTARQIRSAFPDATLPESVEKAINDPQRQADQFELLHAVFPRAERNPQKIDAKNKPFASFHLLLTPATILQESGFDEFPSPVSRWLRWGDTPWGWAPAYHALPDASQANFLEQMLDALAETAAFPRVLVPDGTLKGDIGFDANALTFYDANAGGGTPKEWLTGGRYDIGKDRMADKRAAIRAAFFTDLFNPIAQLSDDATATQVRAIVTESRELFHPIFANMVREDQTPTLRRAFALLLRSGEIPPPPPAVIQEDDLGGFIADPEVEMTSQMALALEQNHLARLGDVLSVLAPVGQADPTVYDYLNTDTLGPALHRYMGLPEVLTRSPENIQAIREARAAQQQQQAALQSTEAVRNLGGPQQAAAALQSLGM